MPKTVRGISEEANRQLAKYIDNLPNKNTSLTSAVKSFLTMNNGDYTRKAIDKHLEWLRSKEYSDGTINFRFRALRRFYVVNSLDWPYKRGEAPVVRETEVFAPALDPNVISAMIDAGREGVLDEQETAIVALSTTYGFRRAEICDIRRGKEPFDKWDKRRSMFDPDNRLLFIESAKGGRQRWHMIPDEILPYLERYDFRPKSLTAISKLFYSIERKIGLPRMHEVGWHSIRRTLDRFLVEAGVPEILIKDFLRWARSSGDMISRYATGTTFVGVADFQQGEGRPARMTRTVKINENERKTDQFVFDAHPFLPVWKGEAIHYAQTSS